LRFNIKYVLMIVLCKYFPFNGKLIYKGNCVMKLNVYLALLAGFMLANHAIAENSTLKTAVGGGVGAAAGTAVGQAVGGNTGAIVGAAVGGGVGGAVTTKGDARTGAIIGGAAGGATGAVVGQKVGGSTGAVVGAGIGGAGGAVIGKAIAEPDNRHVSGPIQKTSVGSSAAYYDNSLSGKKKHPGNGHAYGHYKNKNKHKH
jgi:hypothetical protein